jgi:hypothetical protein
MISISELKPTIAQRFGDVGSCDDGGEFEVGEGTGDAQDAVIAAGREL